MALEKQPEGTWNVYSTYSAPPQKVVETKEKVYFLSGGNLFAYDKNSDETLSYTIGNVLNDTGIADIYRNHERGYLLIAYTSANIDLLYDDGHVTNMSDIKISDIENGKNIVNVAFDGDEIYVATGFGLVKFNEKKAEVITSGNYGKKVNAVTVMGERLMIHSDEHFLWIKKSGNIKSLENFTTIYNHNAPLEIWGVSDNQMVVHLNHPEIVLALHTVNFDTGSMDGWKIFTSKHSKSPSYIVHAPDSKDYFCVDNHLYSIGDGYEEIDLGELPEDIDDGVIGTIDGMESVWSLTNEGLGHFSFDGSGGQTVMMDRFKPQAFSVSKVRFFYPSADGKRLYAQNSGATSYKFGGSTRGLEYAQTAGVIDLETGVMRDVTAYPIEGKSSDAIFAQRSLGKYAPAPVCLWEDTTDPSVYYLGTADDGVLKIKDGKEVGRYDHTNSPLVNVSSRSIVYGASIDRGGNLWIEKWSNDYKTSPIIILPKEKLALDPSQITEADWIHPDLRDIEYWGGMDLTTLHCRRSNIVFEVQSRKELYVCDTRGTFNNFDDDRHYLWESVTDQDGNNIVFSQAATMCEDLNGRVWIGTSSGVFEIASPANALNSNMRVTKLKVPRNDGSNNADYLLGTEQVMSISVDGANRKWIATYGSGLFLVSETGDKIIKNFNTENSPLLSDYVNCVYADRNTGIVWIGTDLGLMSYISDASPARDNYEEVNIYPNPVRPDYHGQVTVDGLMENSLIKIADVSGKVVYQGRSEGGRFIWNLTAIGGSRVKTGVYYVLMSQNSNGSSAAVGKILVVN